MPGVQVGVGYIDIRPDLTGFGRELQTGMTRNIKKTGDDTARTLKGSFVNAAKGAAAAFGAAFAAVKIKDFLGGAIQAASDLNESISKVGVVFGGASIQVKAFADTAAESIGQSEQQALEATGTFGNLFVSMGLGTTTAADMSIKLVQLASDLASFNNVDPAQALDALRSGLVGETEPLRRFGVNLNDATLKQKAFELGLIRSTKQAMDPGVKAQAAYALILEQTTTAQGDFARTADGLANQQRTVTAQWADAKAELGEGLLPVMVSVASFVSDTLIPAWKSLFTSEGDVTGWAATLREVMGDTLGFLVGVLQQTMRLLANVFQAVPFGWGKDAAADLRAAADGADALRDSMHATKLEVQEWAGATRNADMAAKLLAPATKAVTAAMKASIGPTEESAKAERDAAAAARDLLGAKRDIADAERGLAKAQKERDLAARAFAILGTDTAADELADAEENLADAKDTVADAYDRELDVKDRIVDLEAKTVAGTGAFVGAVGARTDAVKLLNDQLGITKDHLGILNDVGNIVGQATGKVLPGPVAPAAPPVVLSPLGAGPSNMIGIPSIAMPKTTTNNVTVNVTQPMPDPGLVGKAIAWALD
jgi:hypothetical protein